MRDAALLQRVMGEAAGQLLDGIQPAFVIDSLIARYGGHCRFRRLRYELTIAGVDATGGPAAGYAGAISAWIAAAEAEIAQAAA